MHVLGALKNIACTLSSPRPARAVRYYFLGQIPLIYRPIRWQEHVFHERVETRKILSDHRWVELPAALWKGDR
jgi:hypothetical protein